MKSKCERFEYLGEMGIFDSLSKRYVNLNGDVQQVRGLQEVQFSDASKKILKDFIDSIKCFIAELDDKAKQDRLKSNFFHEFNKNLNEGYSD